MRYIYKSVIPVILRFYRANNELNCKIRDIFISTSKNIDIFITLKFYIHGSSGVHRAL